MSDDFYSLVLRRVWKDGRFRKLSKPAPNARDLFLYLLTTPIATQIPGLVAIGEAAMAEDLEWPIDGLRACLAELESAGMVKIDREARLLWLPNALKHNPPRSSDNVKGWAKFWRMLPECALLDEAADAMMASLAPRGPLFAAAFARVAGMPEPPPEPMPDPMGDPMVHPQVPPPPRPQYQKQNKDQKITPSPAGARARDEDDGIGDGQPAGEVPVVTAESLLAAVAKHPMLRTLHDDRTWAMRALGGLQGAACRAEDAAAAVDAFVVDNAAKAPGDGPALDDFVRADRTGIGRYLKNAKQHGDRRRRSGAREPDRAGPAPTAEIQVVLSVFGDVWTTKKRRPFVQALGDEKHAASIVARALEEAEKLGVRPRDVVRHWSEQHLACTDRWVVDADHALRTLGAQLTAYGLPKPKKAKAPEVPIKAGPEYVPTPEDFLANLTKGMGT